jgi:hypothetical protein
MHCVCKICVSKPCSFFVKVQTKVIFAALVLLRDLEVMLTHTMLDFEEDDQFNGYDSLAMMGCHHLKRSLLHPLLRKLHIPTHCYQEFRKENTVELLKLMDEIGDKCPGLVSIHIQFDEETDEFLKTSENTSLQHLFLRQLPQLSNLHAVVMNIFDLDDWALKQLANYTPRLEYVDFVTITLFVRTDQLAI